MNTVDQLLAWWHAPAGHTQTGGWLDWFNLLSIGWKTNGAPISQDASPPAPMVDATNGQVLVGLLDQLIK